jgi:hypothetical protein
LVVSELGPAPLDSADLTDLPNAPVDSSGRPTESSETDSHFDDVPALDADAFIAAVPVPAVSLTPVDIDEELEQPDSPEH